METVKISVVVPCYNAERFVRICVNSILNQTYQNFEVILINDGSKDDTLAICEELCSSDERIKLFSQPNGGVTSARYLGVRNAVGEWVTFLDADDTLPIDALENYTLLMDQDTDIIIGNSLYKIDADCYEIEEYRKRCVTCKGVPVGILAHMVKRSLFNDFVFDIPREICHGEDLLLNLRIAYRTNKKVYVAHSNVYNYVMNESSVIHTFKFSMDYEWEYYKCRMASLPVRDMVRFSPELFVKIKDSIMLIAKQDFDDISWMNHPYYKVFQLEKANGTLSFYEKVVLTINNFYLRKALLFLFNIKSKIKKYV